MQAWWFTHPQGRGYPTPQDIHELNEELSYKITDKEDTGGASHDEWRTSPGSPVHCWWAGETREGV